MDAKRLEELAAWASRQKESLQSHGITDIAANYADLARCAAAWAKVKAAHKPHHGKWTLKTPEWGVYLGNGSGGYGCDCPIEAVEAAQEKP